MVFLPKQAATVDYRRWSNDELHQAVCVVDPAMCIFPVTDWTRETVVAILELARSEQKETPTGEVSNC